MLRALAIVSSPMFLAAHRRRSAFSVCFQCMTHAPVNHFLAAQTSLSRSVVGQNVMCM